MTGVGAALAWPAAKAGAARTLTASSAAEIVFNMVETSLLAKTEKDTRDDFQNGYDFTEAFRKPFWPQGKFDSENKPIGG